MKRILILGATGRTGKWIVRKALAHNYDVSVLVRDKKKIDTNIARVTVHEGIPTDIHALTQAMNNCVAVISALNISRTSDFPWAKLRTPQNLLSESVRNIISVASHNKVKRVVVISAWGVGNSSRELPGWFRWVIENSNIAVAYRDHERQEILLKESLLNWTIVRPVGLFNSMKEKKVKVSLNGKPRPSFLVSRQNVANFIIEQLEETMYLHTCPVVYQ